jgi:hypothetical protein
VREKKRKEKKFTGKNTKWKQQTNKSDNIKKQGKNLCRI